MPRINKGWVDSRLGNCRDASQKTRGIRRAVVCDGAVFGGDLFDIDV